MLCVERVLNNDNVLVVVNVRDAVRSIETPAMWASHPVTNLVTGEQTEFNRLITLQPYQYLLLSNK